MSATLDVGVDGRPAVRGAKVVEKALKDIQTSARATARATRDLDSEFRKASRSTGLFGRALAGLGGVVAAREFVRLSDAAILVENRLKIATNSTEELVAVQEELFQISQRTRSSFEANAQIFNRLALSTNELGISLKEVLELTESLNQAVVLSGAATSEATAGLIQLSQGLASNRLSGDELRSVLEQLPVIANVISSELGITRGELKFLGEQGKISAETVVRAFRNAREELAQRFGKTIPTISQGFLQIRNAAIRLTQQFNTSTGVIQLFSRSLRVVADNLDDIARSVFTLAFALGPLVLGKALTSTIAGFTTLIGILRRNPIGVTIAAISGAVGALVNFGDRFTIAERLEEADASLTSFLINIAGLEDEFKKAENAGITWKDVTIAAFSVARDVIFETAKTLRVSFLSAFETLLKGTADIIPSFNDILGAGRTFVNKYIGIFVGVLNVQKFVVNKLAELWRTGYQKVVDKALFPFAVANIQVGNRIQEWFTGIFDTVVEKFNGLVEVVKKQAPDLFDDTALQPVIDTLSDLGQGAADAFLEGFNRDYVSEISAFLDPQIQRVLARALGITEERLRIAAERIAQLDAGQEALRREREANPPTPLDISKFLQKSVEKTRTPLEQLRATLAEIERARPFAKQAEQLTALDRAATQAYRDFAKNVNAEDSPFNELNRQLAVLEQQKGLAKTAQEVFALNVGIEKTKELISDQALSDLGLPETKELLEDAIPPLERYNMTLERLRELLDQGYISQDVFNAAVKRAEEDILGLGIVFKNFAEQAAKNIQTAFADFLFDPFEDGIQGLVSNFADALRRMAAEALSTIILQNLFSSLSTLGGPFGRFFSAGIGALSGNQFGGAVSAGVPVRVGEGGREEVFVPSTSGRVMTSQQADNAMMKAANVQVSNPVNITNVVDPRAMVAVVESSQGQKAVLNVIKANPDAIRRYLS